MTFSVLKKGELFKIDGMIYGEDAVSQAHQNQILAFGLQEGSIARLIHKGPFASSPVVVEVDGMLVGLRSSEASRFKISKVC
jgi:Fe2+ transport system protein FeoA